MTERRRQHEAICIVWWLFRLLSTQVKQIYPCDRKNIVSDDTLKMHDPVQKILRHCYSFFASGFNEKVNAALFLVRIR